MKPQICFPAVLLAVLLSPPLHAAEQSKGVTYVIPIKGQIERALVYAIRRGFAEAERDGAAAIILDMDTPGGRVDAAEDIVSIVTSAKAKTYTFVNPSAMSAGAIIAMATDHIYMAPGGLIGDAMPVIMSPLPTQGPVEIPPGLREKAISPVEALIRSAAQRKGHDPELAAKMVRPETEYKIGDKVICAKDRLLTLTAKDAEELVGEDKHPLLSSGTVKSLDELRQKIGRGEDSVVVVTVSTAEQIARVIDSFPYSGILLALGLLALYLEFKTPGFGLLGVAGILLLAVWFWGHNIAGLAGFGEIILFIIGVLLVLLEVIFFPTYGAIGIAGLGLMIAALLMAMIGHYPDRPWYHPPEWRLAESIKNLGLSFLIAGIVAAILARFLPKTEWFRQLMLSAAVGSNQGYQSSEKTDNLVGLKGKAITQLRPAGTAEFGDKRLDVVTRGDFIDRGKPIVIAEAHGNRIVVDPVEDSGGSKG